MWTGRSEQFCYKGQARVYHLTRQEVQTSNAAMTGTLSISGSSYYVLFDTGASHSFITSYFVEHSEIVLHPLDKLLEASLSLGSKILTNLGVKGCVISIDGHELIADLIVLDVGEFDIILGMDWFSTWHAT